MRGEKPAPERRIHDLANEWFEQVRGIDDDTKKVSETSFSIFCSDANFPVLRVLSLYAEAEGSVDIDSDIEIEGGGQKNVNKPGSENLTDDENAFLEARTSGDQFMAVKPWIGAIVPPTNAPKKPPALPPPSALSLEHVHGYRAHDSRNNVMYLGGSSKAVYYAAAVTVKLDIASNKQTFHMEHTDDILSMAVSNVINGKQLIATGEIGKCPTINVFYADSLQTIISIKGFHRRGVSHLGFSNDNSTLFSIGTDDSHSIAIYSIKDNPGKLLFSSKGNKQKVLHLVPSPFDHSVFAQCGVKHVEFHAVNDKNSGISTKKGKFGKGGITNILCAAFESNSVLLAGTPKGEIFIFESGNFKSKREGEHTSSVNCIQVHPTGSIISGSKDGSIIIWEPGLKSVTNRISMKDIVGEGGLHSSIVRAISPSENLGKILVGTQSSSIYEISLAKIDGKGVQAQENSAATLLSSGHHKGETWGLSCHPTKREYCTVGDDAILRIWDVKTKKLRSAGPAMLKLKSKARTVAYSPDGTKIAVGFGAPVSRGGKKDKNEGSFAIYNEADMATLHEARDSKQLIADIKFSPDGKTLAVGSHDNSVYLYNVLHHYKKKAKFNKHNR